MRTNTLKLAIAGTLLTATSIAVAAPSPATTSLNVTANVTSNCLVSADPLTFADYDASAPVDGSANLTVRCSNGTPYSVKLGNGTHGNIAQRLLKSPANNFLEYNLFTTAARATIWGVAPGSFVSDVGEGMSINKAITHTVYGTIANSALNQDAPTGQYTDAVAVTVEY